MQVVFDYIFNTMVQWSPFSFTVLQWWLNELEVGSMGLVSCHLLGLDRGRGGKVG